MSQHPSFTARQYSATELTAAAAKLGFVETKELADVREQLRQDTSDWKTYYATYDSLGTDLVEAVRDQKAYDLCKIGFDLCKGAILIEDNRIEDAIEHLLECQDGVRNCGYAAELEGTIVIIETVLNAIS